jgi:DNA (cytosine-5)-methyltransferase 1
MNTRNSKKKLIVPKKGKFKFIDLFCGVGGFHQALDKLGGKCVFASDIDEQCRLTYEKNYGLKPHGDITKVNPKTIPDFDILTGGFPCQSFSNSGKKGGFGDKRGQLYENILDIAEEKQPSFMFLENVKHIQKIDNGEVFKHILKRIGETGYHVETFELSPHQLGVPQQRERVIFVCIRNDLYKESIELDMTPPNYPIDVTKIFETDKEKTKKYKISAEHENILEIWDEMVKHFDVGQSMSPTILCNEFHKKYSEKEFSELPQWKRDYITKNKPIYEKYKPHWEKWLKKYKEPLSKREIYGKLEWQAGPKKENDSIFNHFIQFRQSGIRVKKSKYFPTLVAIVQTPIYAKERRHITPRECARLQSFPDSFILHENDQTAYKHFGNAVNVDVVHYVMSRTLNSYKTFC